MTTLYSCTVCVYFNKKYMNFNTCKIIHRKITSNGITFPLLITAKIILSSMIFDIFTKLICLETPQIDLIRTQNVLLFDRLLFIVLILHRNGYGTWNIFGRLCYFTKVK